MNLFADMGAQPGDAPGRLRPRRVDRHDRPDRTSPSPGAGRPRVPRATPAAASSAASRSRSTAERPGTPRTAARNGALPGPRRGAPGAVRPMVRAADDSGNLYPFSPISRYGCASLRQSHTRAPPAGARAARAPRLALGPGRTRMSRRGIVRLKLSCPAGRPCAVRVRLRCPRPPASPVRARPSRPAGRCTCPCGSEPRRAPPGPLVRARSGSPLSVVSKSPAHRTVRRDFDPGARTEFTQADPRGRPVMLRRQPADRRRGDRHRDRVAGACRGPASPGGGPGRSDPRRHRPRRPLRRLLRRDPPRRRSQRLRVATAGLADAPALASRAVSSSPDRRSRHAGLDADALGAGGGNLIAMRPDADSPPCSAWASGRQLANGYMADQHDHPAREPGSRASRCSSMARPIAGRSRAPTSPALRDRAPRTPSPAVTLRTSGARRPGRRVHVRPGAVDRLHPPGQPGLGRAGGDGIRRSAPTICSSAERSEPTGST